MRNLKRAARSSAVVALSAFAVFGAMRGCNDDVDRTDVTDVAVRNNSLGPLMLSEVGVVDIGETKTIYLDNGKSQAVTAQRNGTPMPTLWLISRMKHSDMSDYRVTVILHEDSTSGLYVGLVSDTSILKAYF